MHNEPKYTNGSEKLCSKIELRGISTSELSDIFYTNQKKGDIFHVKLNYRGLTLERECRASKKLASISLSDIIGSRCLQGSPKRSFFARSCACNFLTSSSSVSTSIDDLFKKKENTQKCLENEATGDISAYLYIFAYVRRKNLRNALRRERTVVTLRFQSFDSFDDNINEALAWYNAIKVHKKHAMSNVYNFIEHENGGGRLLVLLNTKCDSGRARDIFYQEVVPILNEAEMPYDLQVTKHSKFAREYLRLCNLNDYLGIVAVGGDGLAFEILNGILQRIDWMKIVRSIPFGIIPCGLGNGLAKSIAFLYGEQYEPNPVVSASLSIVNGHTSPIDLVRIEMKNQILYSLLSVGWGLISDIDIESCRLRALGFQRFTIWSVCRLLSLRTYRGKVAYLKRINISFQMNFTKEKKPLQSTKRLNNHLEKSNHGEYHMSTECIEESKFDDVISFGASTNLSFRSRCDSMHSSGSRNSTYYSVAESVYHSIAGDSDMTENTSCGCEIATMSKIGLTDNIPSTWTIEEGEFIMVHAAYQTHLSLDCLFAPSAKLNDGTIHLVIIRGGISKTQLFNFILNMNSGRQLSTEDNDFIQVIPVSAFRIEPYEDNGNITIDGQLVEFGALHGEILTGVCRVIVP